MLYDFLGVDYSPFHLDHADLVTDHEASRPIKKMGNRKNHRQKKNEDPAKQSQSYEQRSFLHRVRGKCRTPAEQRGCGGLLIGSLTVIVRTAAIHGSLQKSAKVGGRLLLGTEEFANFGFFFVLVKVFD